MSLSASPDVVELHYQDVGSGFPVLFIHGWGMALEVWDRQVTALCDKYRTVCVDLRGHGFSPTPATGYDYDDHAADLRALVERIGLEDLAVVGWSMGGGVAVRLAAQMPQVRQLVLVGAPPRFLQADDAPYGLPREAADQLMGDLRDRREKTMRRVVEDTFHVELGEAVHQWLYQLSIRTPMWSAMRSYEGVLRADVRPDLHALKIPILLLHGVEDIYISIEAARWVDAAVPSARIVEFTESGHAPFLEEPDKFNAQLLAFLR